ncbi:MAG TPA: response regulator [Polyangia bacterium]|nr:response regulator [Polyangia bacterium]
MTPGSRILVVDDEPMIRDSLVEFLEDHGYEAVGAADGREALSVLSGSSHRTGLILLDLMMPFMDGRAFREEQLANPGLSEIPVIVFSAYRDLERTADELQAVAHLPKPLKLSELLRLVRQYCGGEGI